MTQTMQRDLFDESSDLEPRDPNVCLGDRKRLTGQNARILERLKEGPATNVELAQLSLKYTSRISDLRKHGYVITLSRGLGGVHEYELGGRALPLPVLRAGVEEGR